MYLRKTIGPLSWEVSDTMGLYKKVWVVIGGRGVIADAMGLLSREVGL